MFERITPTIWTMIITLWSILNLGSRSKDKLTNFLTLKGVLLLGPIIVKWPNMQIGTWFELCHIVWLCHRYLGNSTICVEVWKLCKEIRNVLQDLNECNLYVPNGLIYSCQCNLKSKLNTLSIQPFKDWRYYMFISTQSYPQILYHFVVYLIF